MFIGALFPQMETTQMAINRCIKNGTVLTKVKEQANDTHNTDKSKNMLHERSWTQKNT